MNIMKMKTGTKIKNKRSGMIYVLGDYVNDVARELKLLGSFSTDYINENTQEEYEVL